MSEIVERVGRALAAQEGYHYDPFPYDVRAHAAIAALRVELLAIRDELAANAADLGDQGYFRRSEGVSLLVSRIDAALAPNPPP